MIHMADVNAKLQKCEVCNTNDAKYTCPKCEVRTCCISCANIHKKELECDGIRDKTKFLPMKSFTDLDILSDYRFLEDVGRSVDRIQNDQSKRSTNNHNFPMVKLQKLKAAAIHRGINLHFMPSNFTRRKENTTYLQWTTGELFWRIQWIFPQAENTKWITERASENTRLSFLLEQVLDPDSILKERLKFYQAVGLCGLNVLLKAEHVEKSDFRYHELDLALTLKENLQNKTIIEFPTLFVASRDHVRIYDVINSDEENVVDLGIRKRNKQPARGNKKSKNFFFDDECSDSE